LTRGRGVGFVYQLRWLMLLVWFSRMVLRARV
jgi:hypothetical protein